MITARELVFYIRAEDQASRVVKRAAGSFGSLSKIKSLQSAGVQQQLNYTKQLENAQLGVRKNLTAIDRAQVAANKSARNLSLAQRTGQGLNATPVADLAVVHQANLEDLATYNKQLELAEANVADIERRSTAAAAANDRLITQAQIERANSYIGALQGVGRAARLMGVVVGASLAFAAHSAAAFQTQLTLAASQARPIGAGPQATAQIATKLQGVVLQQMQKFPASSQDMASALYDIFSSTNIQNIKQAGNLLTTLNKAAVGGGVDLGTMSNAAITLFNNFVVGGKKGGDEFNNLNQAMNVFFSAVRYGRMNATQYANALSYVAGIAKEAGENFTDVSDAMAILTRQTGASRTNQDAQGLARLIQQLTNPDAIAGLKKIGIQAVDPLTNKLKPLLDIITQITQKANLKGINALNFFKTITASGGGGAGNKGTIQAQRAFAYLTNNIGQYQKVAKEVNSDNDEFAKSFIALSKSPGVQWQVLINQFKALAIVIGVQAIPAFVKLGEPIVHLLAWFNGLSAGAKHTIAVFGVFGSAGAIAAGTFIIIAGAAAKLYNTVRILKLESLASDAGSVTTKFALMGGALTAVVLLFIMFPHQTLAVVNALGGLKNVIEAVTTAMIAFKVQAMLAGLLSIEGDAAAAATEVGILSKALLVLSKLGPIAIAVTVTEIIMHRGAIDKFVSKELDKAHLPGGTNEQSLTKLASTNNIFRGQAQNYINQEVKAAQHGNKQAMKLINSLYGKGWDKPLEQVPKLSDQARRLGTIAMQNIVTGNNAAAVAVKKHAATWTSLLNNVIALDKLSKTDPSLKNFQNLLDAEDKLQKASTGNQYAAAQQYLSQLESTWTKADSTVAKHVKNMEALQKKNEANAKSMINTLEQGVEGMYNNLLQQNQTLYGTIFQGPVVSGARVQDNLQFGGHVTGLDLLKDLKAQNFQFNRTQRSINTLAKRGAPKALVNQIRAAGADAIPDIKALMGLTPEQFKEYIRAFNAGQTAIKKNTMTQLNSQLKVYESFGKKVAQAIIKGVSSQDPALTNVLKNSVLQMFPGLATQAHIKSTSPKSTTDHPGTVHHHNTTYNIQPAKGDVPSIMTAVRHGEYRNRAKHKGNK